MVRSTGLIALLLAMVLALATGCAPATTEPPATTQVLVFGDEVSNLSLEIVSLTSPVAPHGCVTLVARTLPGATCRIEVNHRALANDINGFYSQTANGNGEVTWTWQVGRSQGTFEIFVRAEYEGQIATAGTLLQIEEMMPLTINREPSDQASWPTMDW